MSKILIALISSYSVCIACLIILLCGMWAHRTERKLSNNSFTICLVFCILGMVADGLSYILEGRQGIDVLLAFVNTCSLLNYGIITTAIMYYIWDLLNSKSPVSVVYAHIGAAICIVDMVFYILGSVFGYTFTVENGLFVYKPLARVGQIVEMALMCYFVSFALIKGRKSGPKIIFAVVTYILLPLIALVAYSFDGEVSFSYVAISLVLTIVYVMIQADEQEKLIVQENIILKASNTDMLTSLQNRRAYSTRIAELAESKAVGVLFCDLNGLKAINDTEGHAAGDCYIVKFANLLRQSFREEDIFRISGDEFVVLLDGATDEIIQETTVTAKRIFVENNNIAAVGSAFGDGASLLDSISLAEHEMYADKSRYYISSGKDRRVR